MESPRASPAVGAPERREMIESILGGGRNGNSGFPSLLMQRYQRLNSMRLNQSLVKLATGMRINRGADDPAGLIASEQLRSTLASLEAESQSLQRADQQASVADGALQQVSDLLSEANGLAVANANGGALSDLEKRANQLQIDSIMVSVDRISRTTSFNGTKLLDGSFELSATNRTLPVDSTATSNLGATTVDGTSYALADLKSGGSLDTTGGTSETAQQVIAAATQQVATLRGQIGSFQKHTIQTRLNSIDVARVNLAAAESQIRDLDYAAEMSNKIRYELLHRASLSLIARRSPRGRSIDLRV
jgi:flagellin-like hook-associated protein FlgL